MSPLKNPPRIRSRTPSQGTARKAFTLIELVVSIGITSVLMLIIFGILSQAMGTWTAALDESDVSRRANKVLDALAEDLSAFISYEGKNAWMEFYKDQATDRFGTYKTSTLYFITSTKDGPEDTESFEGELRAIAWKFKRSNLGTTTEPQDSFVLSRAVIDAENTFSGPLKQEFDITDLEAFNKTSLRGGFSGRSVPQWKTMHYGSEVNVDRDWMDALTNTFATNIIDIKFSFSALDGAGTQSMPIQDKDFAVSSEAILLFRGVRGRNSPAYIAAAAAAAAALAPVQTALTAVQAAQAAKDAHDALWNAFVTTLTERNRATDIGFSLNQDYHAAKVAREEADENGEKSVQLTNYESSVQALEEAEAARDALEEPYDQTALAEANAAVAAAEADKLEKFGFLNELEQTEVTAKEAYNAANLLYQAAAQAYQAALYAFNTGQTDDPALAEAQINRTAAYAASAAARDVFSLASTARTAAYAAAYAAGRDATRDVAVAAAIAAYNAAFADVHTANRALSVANAALRTATNNYTANRAAYAAARDAAIAAAQAEFDRLQPIYAAAQAQATELLAEAEAKTEPVRRALAEAEAAALLADPFEVASSLIDHTIDQVDITLRLLTSKGARLVRSIPTSGTLAERTAAFDAIVEQHSMTFTRRVNLIGSKLGSK